ncbi:MAG: glycosyltransferase [Candidatus Eisenbacteria bacterium]
MQIPYNHIGIIKAINHLAMLGTLRSAMPRSVAPRVVLTNWPFLDHLVGALQETVFIYYRVDDYAEMPGVKRSYIRKVEDRLMDKADLIVATSQGLVPEGRWRAKGRYLPHGVDFEHFRGGKRGQCGALSQLPSPRIGFFGLIDDWVDVELVEELAAAHPEWQFILAGRCRAQVGSLEVLKNVHVIGQVDYRQLPDVGAEFDVGVIPFRLNALTLCVNPLKLLEYFALGLPVVGVRLPEVVNFEDKVLLADNADEFARRIEDALGESGEVRRAARQKLASEHSWSRRATELKSWIADALGETKSARRPE